MTRASERILAVAFLVVPYLVLGGGIIHRGHHYAFLVLGACLAGSLLPNLWLRLFVYYACVWQMFIMVQCMNGRHSIALTAMGLAFILSLGVACVIIYVVSTAGIDRRFLYNIICLSSIAQAFIAVCQIWGADPYFWLLQTAFKAEKHLPDNVTTGTLGNNNFLAAYLAMTIPFFCRKYWAFFIPVFLLLLFLSITATAIVAMSAGLLYLAWPYVKKQYLALAAVPVIVYLCIFKRSLTVGFTFHHDRFEYWATSIKQVTQSVWSFLFGLGPASQWGKTFPVHNDYVTFFHHFGFIAILLLVLFFLSLTLRPQKDRLVTAAFITACVNAIGNYPMHLAPSAFLILIIIGLMIENRGLSCRSRQLEPAFLRATPLPTFVSLLLKD